MIPASKPSQQVARAYHQLDLKSVYQEMLWLLTRKLYYFLSDAVRYHLPEEGCLWARSWVITLQRG